MVFIIRAVSANFVIGIHSSNRWIPLICPSKALKTKHLRIQLYHGIVWKNYQKNWAKASPDNFFVCAQIRKFSKIFHYTQKLYFLALCNPHWHTCLAFFPAFGRGDRLSKFAFFPLFSSFVIDLLLMYLVKLFLHSSCLEIDGLAALLTCNLIFT